MDTHNNYKIPVTSKDWNDLWKIKQSLNHIDHDSTYWNKRAKSFTNKDTPGSYTDRFFHLADIQPADSVMDMGCGTGNIAIPLGLSGHEVLAADFSSVMLQRLSERAANHNLTDVHPIELSWSDDWEQHGIKPDSYDVCLASRSIATKDLRAALLKLTSTAKRYVCITLPCDSSPKIDDRALREIGIETHPSYDSAYALAILQGEGYYPEIRCIKTERIDEFETFEAAVEKYSDMLDIFIAQNASTISSEISRDKATERITNWLKDNLVEAQSRESNDSNDPSNKDNPSSSHVNSKVLTLKHPRETTWAFLSWYK